MDVSRRVRKRVGRQRRFLPFRQRRGRIARSAAQRLHCRNPKPALTAQHADQHRARGRFAHQRRRRRFPSQCVINQSRDGGAIARIALAQLGQAFRGVKSIRAVGIEQRHQENGGGHGERDSQGGHDGEALAQLQIANVIADRNRHDVCSLA